MAAMEGAMPTNARYGRVLLKISGEALMGNREYGLDPEIAAIIRDLPNRDL